MAGPEQQDDGPDDRPDDRRDDRLVDWDLAARTATRLVRPGPQVSPSEARRVVDLVRAAAAESPPHVARVSQLLVPAGPPARVVERGAWARANVASFASLLSPVVDEALDERRARAARGSLRGLGVARRVTGVQLGSLLALLSSRVLGQYDALGEGPGTGDLLVVAPNVLAVQRELGLDLRDFARWVCLHEETHRVQFAAAPWLADHLRGRARALSGDVLRGPGAGAERVAQALRGLRGAVDGVRGSGSGSGAGLLDLATTVEQRRSLAEVTAVMALLEGHADVVMDDVGPSVIPTVATIRRKFTARRGSSRGLLDTLLRHGLGLEAKLRQYADGARFVRGVVAQVGTGGFNAVWSSPAALPRPEEVADPAAWVRRVHG
ncbi:coenzyme F420 biosynthesis-associated protein [Streptomyces sp. NP160]|uniref:zinc-dependent metalloprotease n=1 Tax=Streptomyces sp. NP160 TaxID=2586637 RepID=UPI00111875C9|nr:zinc-dependent metalloprotease [Streptomyces sp. NP160]TNM69998.1 coenzyme F420 biosynthesis-associated protein [Streptomyces sp. NP160]